MPPAAFDIAIIFTPRRHYTPAIFAFAFFDDAAFHASLSPFSSSSIIEFRLYFAIIIVRQTPPDCRHAAIDIDDACHDDIERHIIIIYADS
jgi:hypothetical protein